MKILFALSLLFGTFAVNAQTCEAIYPADEITEPAAYKWGDRGLFEYVTQNVLPLLHEGCTADGELVTKLHVRLVIDNEGKVLEATITKPELVPACKSTLEAQFLRMQAWQPATYNGRNVCSEYVVPVSCIKWQ